MTTPTLGLLLLFIYLSKLKSHLAKLNHSADFKRAEVSEYPRSTFSLSQVELQTYFVMGEYISYLRTLSWRVRPVHTDWNLIAPTYVQYKEHTCNWLGWVLDLCDENGSKTVRNEHTNCPLPTAEAELRPVYEVTTKEILRQAQYLATCYEKTGFKWAMPKEIWRSYQSAYKTRVQYAHRCAATGEADDGHAYFNAMMENVHNLLRNCVKVQSLSKASSIAAEVEDPTMFENSFQELEEEDPAEDKYLYDDSISEASSAVGTSFEYRLDESFDDHVQVIKQNLAIENFQRKRKVLSDMYGPMKDYIMLLWKRQNAGDGVASLPEVASLVTEAAVVWIARKEEELYDYGESHKAELGETQWPIFDFSSSGSKYLYSNVVKDVRAARQMFTISYPTTLKPLDLRHQDKASCFSNEDDMQQLLVEDKLIVQLLGEIQLEMVRV